MRYPLNSISVVYDGQFGTDPQTYAQFNLAGHNGVDLVASVGTPVFAPEDATVTVSSNGTTDQYTGAPVAGEVMVLKGTYEHWLLHLSIRNVSKGDQVKEGQLIGLSGNTGFTTGPHLHWGVRPLYPNIKNGFRGFIDPMEFMKEGDEMIASPQFIQKALKKILNVDVALDSQDVKNYTNKNMTEGQVVTDIMLYSDSDGRDFASTLEKAITADAKYVADEFEDVTGVRLSENDPQVQVYVGKSKEFVRNDIRTWGKQAGVNAASLKEKLSEADQSKVDTALKEKADKYDQIKEALK